MSFSSRMRRDLFPDVRTMSVVVLLTVIWYLFLTTRAQAWQPIVVAAWAWLPMAFLPLIAGVSGVTLLRHQLATPAPASAPATESSDPPLTQTTKGIYIIVTNGVIILIRLLAYSALAFIGGLWILQRSLGMANLLDLLPIPAPDWFVALMAVAYVSLLVGSWILSQVIQTAFVISRFSTRLQALLGLWLTVLILWASLRAIPIISDLFAWLPHMTFPNVASVGDIYTFTTSYLDTGPMVATIITTIAMMAISSYAIDALRKSEKEEAQAEQATPTISTSQSQDLAPPVRSRYARRPARLPTLRERFLIIVFAASALVVYDLFSGGLAVTTNPGAIFARPAVANHQLRGFYQDRPFLSKRGAFELPYADVSTLIINASGDIELFGHDEDTVSVDYVIRAYGDSAQHSQALYDRVDIRPLQHGGELTLQTVLPSIDDASSVRVSYQVRVPRDLRIHVNADESIVHIHDLFGQLHMDLTNTSLYISKVDGGIDITSTGSDLTVVDSVGHLEIDLTDGVLEVHAHQGNAHVHSRNGSIDASGLRGALTASLHRGFASFRGIHGPVELQSTMTHIDAVQVDGQVQIDGIMSPINLVDVAHDATVTTDRGNVTVSVSNQTKWAMHIDLERARLIDDALQREDVHITVSPAQAAESRSQGSLADPDARQLTVKAKRADVKIR